MKPRVFIMGYPGTGQAGTLDDLNAEKSYRAMPVHMNTVAGNEMLVLDAPTRYPNATFFGLNPGLIKTNIRDNFLGKDTLKSRASGVADWPDGSEPGDVRRAHGAAPGVPGSRAPQRDDVRSKGQRHSAIAEADGRVVSRRVHRRVRGADLARDHARFRITRSDWSTLIRS